MKEKNEILLRTEDILSIEQLEERLEMEACCSGCTTTTNTTVIINK